MLVGVLAGSLLWRCPPAWQLCLPNLADRGPASRTAPHCVGHLAACYRSGVRQEWTSGSKRSTTLTSSPVPVPRQSPFRGFDHDDNDGLPRRTVPLSGLRNRITLKRKHSDHHHPSSLQNPGTFGQPQRRDLDHPRHIKAKAHPHATARQHTKHR